MDVSDFSVGPQERTTYRCTTGHEIAGATLDELTEVRSLDNGALVRICREHGAAVSLHLAPLQQLPNG